MSSADRVADWSGTAGDGLDRSGTRLGGVSGDQVGEERVVELASYVALEASDDLGLRFAFGGPSLGVGAGALAVAQPAHCDHVQRAVGVPVAAIVEAVAVGASGRDGQRAGAAQRGERRFASQSLDVLASGDQERAGVAA